MLRLECVGSISVAPARARSASISYRSRDRRLINKRVFPIGGPLAGERGQIYSPTRGHRAKAYAAETNSDLTLIA